MKKLFALALLIVTIAACQSEKDKPNPFIEQQKMEDILYDVSLLYGIQSTNSFGRDSVAQFDMNAVLNKYGIDSLTFAENNRYYVELKGSVYYDMQKRILQRLEVAKTAIDSLVGNSDELKIEKLELTEASLEVQEEPKTVKVAEKPAQKPVKKKEVNLQKMKVDKKMRERILKLREAKENAEPLPEKPREVETPKQ